ncbi:hypothetical protein CW745_13970 [Psychromonas sp. psych-6C06]|uniref:hypothetical protein n=1 Tax=Psychromonas sp. psych-6C06 TaxID=2058089 RepID=UPI000C348C46|nr:hypothetical protein [Psychromonas sp. psych-6C06]PKF60633.1 hypothetical protein CW745_13970 [Psychromonas sp. psych-6C06]
MAKTVNERKQQQREKLKLMDIIVVEVKLSANERALLDEGCSVRGGVRGAYSRDEYIATLIRNDSEKLKRDLSQLKGCEKCNSPVPGGCEGVFKGDAHCFHTTTARSLML